MCFTLYEMMFGTTHSWPFYTGVRIFQGPDLQVSLYLCPSGIISVANNCYASSVLQCLISHPVAFLFSTNSW